MIILNEGCNTPNALFKKIKKPQWCSESFAVANARALLLLLYYRAEFGPCISSVPIGKVSALQNCPLFQN